MRKTKPARTRTQSLPPIMMDIWNTRVSGDAQAPNEQMPASEVQLLLSFDAE
jgi:hypothetical protein